MATVNERLILEDQFSAAFNRFISLSERASGAVDDVRYSLFNIETATATTAQSMDRLANEIANMTNRSQQSTQQTRSLVDVLKQLGIAAAGVKAAQWLVSTSDTMTQTTARLNMMNDGLQTTEELTQMIYQAAQNSRGAFSTTADMVGKLGTLAGSAFNSSGEIVAFAEQLNKQITLSGASTQAADAAMLQLTQAMSSGVLRGEELNSILEQTPMVAQTIAKYLGVSTGQMRELASEGQVTAEVVKNAILGATEETNAAFESMPMTWGQVWTSMQNTALMALQPVLNGINFLANNIDSAVDWINENLSLVEMGLSALATAAVIAGANMAAAGATAAAVWIAANLHLVLIAASVGLIILMARQAGATWEQIGAVIGGVFGGIYAAAMNDFIVPAQNAFAAFVNFFGNMFNDPVAAIQILILDLAIFIVGKVQQMAQALTDLINLIPGVEVNLAAGLENIYSNLKSTRQNVIDNSDYKEIVKAWDFVDYGNAIQSGASIGSSWGEKLDNFSLSNIMGSVGNTVAYSAAAWDDMSSDVSSIAGDTSSINKAVNMGNEDLKNLVDMAERQYVNKINLTAQTPVITVNGANTGNTQADRQNLANTIRDILIEQVAAGSTRATARQYSGG